MKRVLFLLVLACLLPAVAFAYLLPSERENKPSSPSLTFTCAPEEFTLTKTTQGYRLEGAIQTPTPGFSYDIDGETERNGILSATMTLSSPDGAVLAVLDALRIEHDFKAVSPVSRLSLHIDKDFHWGPEEISCTAEGGAPQ